MFDEAKERADAWSAWFRDEGMDHRTGAKHAYFAGYLARARLAAPAQEAPAPYVPKPGDVVECYPGEQRLVTAVAGGFYLFCDLRTQRHGFIGDVRRATYLRPATAEELVAAGLPSSEVDVAAPPRRNLIREWREEDALIEAKREAFVDALAVSVTDGDWPLYVKTPARALLSSKSPARKVGEST